MAEASPLAEIERAALEEANERRIDVADSGADATLRSIIAALVERWRADYRRGLRNIDLHDPGAITERAMRNLTGYGPLEPLLAEIERRPRQLDRRHLSSDQQSRVLTRLERLLIDALELWIHRVVFAQYDSRDERLLIVLRKVYHAIG